MTNFYKSIRDNYEKIFPLNSIMADFIYESSKGVDYLDIACGTGLMAEELVRRGKKLVAIDLEDAMVESARKKGLEVFVMDMLNLNFDKKFDLIYCVGNSLAHLESFGQVDIFINRLKNFLKEDGIFIVQVVNFSRYLGNGEDYLGNLPTIENQGIIFERKYFAQGEKIRFNSILHSQGRVLENNQSLLPITRAYMVEVLSRAGFKCEIFGGFDKSPFVEDESFALVIRATLGE